MSDLPFVLDASVLAKLAIAEPGAPSFLDWVKANAGEEMVAPALAFSEVGRAVQKANPRGPAKDLAALQERALRSISLRPPSEGAAVWAVADGLSFYDAEYVRLAQRLGAVLVTADHKMAERARKAGVQVKEF